MGLLETAAATLIGGERRIDTAARNVTNVNTPGYKREISYSQILNSEPSTDRISLPLPTTETAMLNSQGALIETGNPFDVAINGNGRLLVRDGTSFVLSRGGQFAHGPGGNLTDALGRVLQQVGGGDLEISGGQVTILADGTVLENGTPVGAVGLFAVEEFDPALRLSAEQASVLSEDNSSQLRQGMLERSNVVLSDEMVDLMRTQRLFESGAQMIRTYNELMSQAISTFSRSGR